MERAYQKVEYKTAQHQLWIERTRKLSTELQRLAFKYCNRIGHTYIYILGFGSNLIITYFHEIKVPHKKGAVEIKNAKISELYRELNLSFLSASST